MAALLSARIKTAPVQLTVYNYRPDIEKTVTKRNNDKAHQADYGVGDAVPYTLTIDVPKNITSLRTFKVTDTTGCKPVGSEGGQRKSQRYRSD